MFCLSFPSAPMTPLEEVNSFIKNLQPHKDSPNDKVVEVLYYDNYLITMTITSSDFHDIYACEYKNNDPDLFVGIKYSRDSIVDIGTVSPEFQINIKTENSDIAFAWDIITDLYPGWSSQTEIWSKTGNNSTVEILACDHSLNIMWLFYSVDTKTGLILEEKTVDKDGFDSSAYTKIHSP